MDVLSEAVADAKKDAADLRPMYRDRTGRARTDRQINRYLRGESFPPAREIDQWVQVVADATGADRFEFWRVAIGQAEGREAAEPPVGEAADRATGRGSATGSGGKKARRAAGA